MFPAPFSDPTIVIGVDASPAELPAPLRACLEGIDYRLVIAPTGPAARAPHVDLLVAWIEQDNGGAMAWVLRTSRVHRWAESVFITAPGEAAANHALRAAGLPHVVGAEEARAWLATAVEPLARLARARRAVESAERAVPPSPPAAPPDPGQGLFRAEQSFRETYLQALLQQTSSRSEAAARARLPYRTLCNMITKLQLGGGDGAAPLGREQGGRLPGESTPRKRTA